MRLGLLQQTAEKFSILELTPAGCTVLRERTPVTLSRQMAPPVFASPPSSARSTRGGQMVCDEALFECLRRLRKRLADARNVPAYIIFSDVSLRQMARDVPRDEQAFCRITGVGEKKLQEFAKVFLSEILAHVDGNSGGILE